MDFRKTFDRIPDQFDKWRPRYCDELFRDIIEYANIGPGKSVIEIGPGTGSTGQHSRCGKSQYYLFYVHTFSFLHIKMTIVNQTGRFLV